MVYVKGRRVRKIEKSNNVTVSYEEESIDEVENKISDVESFDDNNNTGKIARGSKIKTHFVDDSSDLGEDDIDRESVIEDNLSIGIMILILVVCLVLGIVLGYLLYRLAMNGGI